MTKSKDKEEIQNEEQNKLKEYPCTDTGNMERFVDQHQGYLRSLGTIKTWLVWDGTRWKPSDYAEVFKFALETVQSIKTEVEEAEDFLDAQTLQKWSLTSQSEPKMRAMLNMASNHPLLVSKASSFDKQKMKLNCLNGIVDLKTGQLNQRTSDDLHTKVIGTNFNPQAKCPNFDKFIKEVFGSDGELISWIQRAFGYSLTGSAQEQVLFICYGTGANGKSTLLETISKILGDYSTNADFEMFLSNQKSDVRVMEAVGELKGIRLALASEVDASKRFNESLVKRLTGGDTLRGTRLHMGAFQFEPQHKLWFLCNHIPFARDGSHGFWRRIKVIPFAQQFQGASLDSSLPDKLWAEREGILAWMIRGAVAWAKELQKTNATAGLGPCKAIDQSIEEYRYDNDLSARFIEECLVRGDDFGSIGARELYFAYQRWWSDNSDEDTPSEGIFSRRMEERGLKKTRTKAGVVYKGVKLIKTNPSYNF
ncbi:phage/plasmid primase, P4 family [Alphaproteobacteria bacterium]|nr:phage/plasmid primase, P4 family [Alphaproteobacteria bacterium]